MDTLSFDWKEKVVYSPEGPQPQVLMEDSKVKLLVAGLEPGQKIPVHPEAMGIYYFLKGSGWFFVEDQRFSIHPGLTVVAPDGAARGVDAETRVAFLAVRVV